MAQRLQRNVDFVRDSYMCHAQEFERKIKSWLPLIHSSTPAERKRKATVFIGELNLLTIMHEPDQSSFDGFESGKPDFGFFRNKLFMEGIHEIFLPALGETSIDIEWYKVERLINSNATVSRRDTTFNIYGTASSRTNRAAKETPSIKSGSMENARVTRRRSTRASVDATSSRNHTDAEHVESYQKEVDYAGSSVGSTSRPVTKLGKATPKSPESSPSDLLPWDLDVPHPKPRLDVNAYSTYTRSSRLKRSSDLPGDQEGHDQEPRPKRTKRTPKM